MTSGAKTTREAPRRRAFAPALALAAMLAGVDAHAFDLTDLASLLAQRRSGQARFTEQRFVKGFDAPLVSSGTLDFQAPDRFTRRTLEPRDETLSVAGNMLTLTRGGRSRTLALDAAPEAEVAVEAVRGALTGDAATLRRWFRVDVAGDAAHWTMALVPLDAQAAGPLAQVRIEGRRDAIDTIETRLADETRTVMKIAPVAAGTPAASAP